MEPLRIPRDLLAEISVFGALSADALEFLLEHASRVSAGTGQFLFREGDLAQSMYIVESGRVVVLKHWEGTPYLLNTLGPGQCFGEMALMDMYPRSASVLALQDTSAVKLSAAALLELHDFAPEQFTLLQMNLGREVCRRLRRSQDHLFHTRIGADPGEDAPAFPRFEMPD